MAAIRQRLADTATYRQLGYLLSAMPLGLVWFVALVTVWSLCLGLVVTPLCIPLAIGLAYMTRGFAAVEAELARSLLEIDARAPSGPEPGGRFWARFRALFGAPFWRAQAFLLIRWFAGFPLALAVLIALLFSVAMISAPIWLPLSPSPADLGIWKPHTLLQSLAFVPAGLLLLPATLLLARPLARIFRPIVWSLLPASNSLTPAQGDASTARPVDRRRRFRAHAWTDASVALLLIVIWAVTGLGDFWPIWVILPLGLALGIHGWFVLLDEDPSIVGRFRGSRTLAGACGVGAVLTAFYVGIWAAAGLGYFWPVWPMIAIAIVLGVIAVSVRPASPAQAEMAERIETLETSRAGAVDLQDSELRRIERDLHDGAQARLVALGMSLGMAEQKLASDPERVGELLAEARAGAEHALRELRDLARGIHPPVLADRGLEAAIASLASSTPIEVALTVELPRRPAPPVETAVYFVVAEALANTAKHARADHIAIRIHETGQMLHVKVQDDGIGGANPAGTGLRGMRRRVEALDGRLSVTSPHGGPTTIRAEVPCAS